MYWNEVYPKLGEAHMRLSMEREILYAVDFPFVDYGVDIALMAEMEKGYHQLKIKRSDVDSDPPEEVKLKIERSLLKIKSKR